MKKDWKKIYEGERRPGLEQKIFESLRLEIEKNKKFDWSAMFRADRRAFIFQGVSAFAIIAGFSYFLIKRSNLKDTISSKPLAKLSTKQRMEILGDPELPFFDSEMLHKSKIIAQYDFLLDLDVLEKWEIS